MRPQTYEIVIAGRADTALCAEFDDCEVSVGLDTTTLHADGLDQAALIGLVLRIVGLGLEVIHVHRLPPAVPAWLPARVGRLFPGRREHPA